MGFAGVISIRHYFKYWWGSQVARTYKFNQDLHRYQQHQDNQNQFHRGYHCQDQMDRNSYHLFTFQSNFDKLNFLFHDLKKVLIKQTLLKESVFSFYFYQSLIPFTAPNRGHIWETNIQARTIFSSFSKYRTAGRHAGDHHGSPFPNRVFSLDTSKNINRRIPLTVNLLITQSLQFINCFYLAKLKYFSL